VHSTENIKKYNTVIQAIRREIVEGVYGPGHRLPTRSEMGARLGVGVATVQKAVDVLVEDGFIQANAREGTYVVARPPHLCNFALVSSAQGKWSRLYIAVQKAAGMIQTESLRLSEYLTSRDVGSREDVNRLCRDVCEYKVAGLILTGFMEDIVGTPVLEHEGIPRVRGMHAPESNIPLVRMDTYGSFLSRAVEYLASRGRRRIAHLRLVSKRNERESFDAALRRTGVECRDYWVQSAYLGPMAETVPGVVKLLMQLDGDKRPDALIIYDDNLVENAVTGLMASGVKIPSELEVVAHFNYPMLAPTTLPMKWLGFDCRAWLRKCVEVLEMQRRGLTPAAETVIPAVFEDELEKNDPMLLGESQ
jgi:DNA-binding LacI/PurR family transcriptional regulator